MSLNVLKEVIKGYEYGTVTVEQIESLTIMLQHQVFEPIFPDIVAKIKELDEAHNLQQKKIQQTQIKEKSTNNATSKRPVEHIEMFFTLSGFDVEFDAEYNPVYSE